MTDVDNIDTTQASPVDGEQEPSTPSEAQSGTLLTSEPSSASEPTVPETYKLALPDDTPLDPAAIDRVTSLAKSLKVTSDDSAQAIAEAIHKEVVTFQQSQLEAHAKGGAIWKARVAEMEKQALSDPDIGGTTEKLQQAVQHSRQVLDRFGDATVRDFLEESGLGSSPALIKMLTRIHRAMGEDTFVTTSVAPKSAPKSLAERIYG